MAKKKKAVRKTGPEIGELAPLFGIDDREQLSVDILHGNVVVKVKSQVILSLAPSDADYLGDLLKTHAKHAKK